MLLILSIISVLCSNLMQQLQLLYLNNIFYLSDSERITLLKIGDSFNERHLKMLDKIGNGDFESHPQNIKKNRFKKKVHKKKF